ncbi:MAG: hypothetical protein ACP5P3_08920 [Ignavibacteria bacterium]
MTNLIRTDVGFLAFVLSVLAALVLTYFYYRKQLLPRKTRFFLSLLRFLTLFFLFLLLTTPILTYISSRTLKPINILLLDNSLSMELGRRDSIARVQTEKIKNLSNLDLLLFSQGINFVPQGQIPTSYPDSIVRTSTNFSQTLNDIKNLYPDNTIASVTVLSDGNFNEGENILLQAQILNCPFNYFLIGDTAIKRDIAIEKIDFNKISYIHTRTPIKVTISNSLYTGSITVNLFEENALIETQTVTITAPNEVTTITFYIEAGEPGIKKYRIGLEPINNEFTTLNNYEDFYIKFLDNQFKILVISGAPSPDYAFLKSTLESIAEFRTTFRTLKTASDFYEGNFPDNEFFNCLILIDFPDKKVDDRIVIQLAKYIQTTEPSIFLFFSDRTSGERLKQLTDIIPLSITTVNESYKSSIYASDNTGLSSQFKLLPPVFVKHIGVNISIIPKLFSTLSNMPVYFISQNTHIPFSIFSATNFYRWRLNELSLDGVSIFRSFLASEITSLIDRKKTLQLLLETDKAVYSPYDKIKISIRLNNPLTSTANKVNLFLRTSSDSLLGVFNLENSSYVETQIRIKHKAEYQLFAQLLAEDNVIATDLCRFTVDQNLKEYRDTKSISAILNTLATNTNGKNLSNLSDKEIKQLLIHFISLKELQFQSPSQIILNFNPIVLLCLIIFLSVEWFLRKKNNLF